MRTVDSKRDRRVGQVNLLLAIISDDSGAFVSRGVISKFEIDNRGRVRFFDSFSQKTLLVWLRWGKHNGFSESYGMREVVRGLADYIRGRGMTTGLPEKYASRAKDLGIEIPSN